MAISGMAQSINSPHSGTADKTDSRKNVPQTPIGPDGKVKATDLIGMAVENGQHEKLGAVQDFVLDVESGRIVQVILTRGGFMGLRTKHTAVPPEALHYKTGYKVLRLDASKEKVGQAHWYDASKWNEEVQSNRVFQVYAVYGEQIHLLAGQGGFWTNQLFGTVTTKYPRNMDGTINTSGGRTADTAHNVRESKDAVLIRIPDGTWTEGSAWIENTTNSWWASLGHVARASRIIGTPIENLRGGKPGRVDDLMVNLAAGRIDAIIISSGGYMGMGVHLWSVPPTAVRFNPQHDALQLDDPYEVFANSSRFNYVQ